MRENILFTLSLLLFLGLILTGCRDSALVDSNNIDNETNSDGWQPVELAFEASEQSVPKVRAALNPEDENAINQVRVLVFDNTGTFNYEAKVTSVTPDADNRTGAVQLLAKDITAGTLVMLSNVAATPNEATIKALTDKTIANVLEQFEFNATDSWMAGTFPMWGQLENITINHSTPNPIIGGSGTTFHLIRAVARIDVGLNVSGTQFEETAAGITGIDLTAVHFFNMNNKGCVAPAATNYSATDNKVTAPTIPGSASSTVNFNKQINGNLLQRSVYVPEAINENTTTTDYMTRPYMVVGLTKDGTQTFYRIDFLKKNGEEAIATYEYLPLLRNYRYLVNIKKVGGPGFATIADAQRGPAANIMYSMEAWNESTMSNVLYDGQYMLGVSEDSLTYYNRIETQSIKVRTSYPDGWTAAVTSPDSEWLTIDNPTGASGVEVNLGISVKKNIAENAVTREGIVTITAGRMSWEVKVKQLNQSKISLNLYEEDGVTPLSIVDFHAFGGEKTIVVKYQPSDGIYELTKVNGDDFVIEEVNVNATPGERRYRIKANPMVDLTDNFEVIDNFVQIKITADDGRTLRQILTINQTEYNIIPYKNKINNQLINNLLEGEPELYLMNGEEKVFYIKSNLPYKLELIDNHPNPIYGGVSTEYLIKDFVNTEHLGKFSGEQITFTTYNDLPEDEQKRVYGTAKFKITSLRKDETTGVPLVEREFMVDLATGIIQPEANCYLMRPGKVGILIPVSRVNNAKLFYDGYADQMRDHHNKYALGSQDWDNKIAFPSLGVTDEWKAELVWSDMEYEEALPALPVKPDGTAGFRIIKKVGVGNETYIYILPGKTKTGNALVCCRQAEVGGNILWSWHLWVVDEYPMQGHIDNPNSTQILDRNLGANAVATSYTDATKESYGMQYQYGRKDPFPIRKDDGYRTLVGKDGQNFDIYQGATYITMKQTIMYPSQIERNNNNWMYEVGRINRGLRVWYEVWGGVQDDTKEQNGAWTKDLQTDKSYFDPSPYGWKVPAMGQESNWKNEIATGSLILPLSGYFRNGEISSYQNGTTYYGLSTVHSSDIAPRAIKFGNNGQAPSVELDKSFNRSGTVVIRSIYNSNESDYKEYLP